MAATLHVVLQCADAIVPRARYVLDTLFMAVGIPVVYSPSPPSSGVWLLYAPHPQPESNRQRRLWIAHLPESWGIFSRHGDIVVTGRVDGIVKVLPGRVTGADAETDIEFDLVANAFYFLSSWAERSDPGAAHTRRLHSDSVFGRLGVPQDIVDQYLHMMVAKLGIVCNRTGCPSWTPLIWPQGADYALVLSHDVDFLPTGRLATIWQGTKTFFRHLVRQRDVADAFASMAGLARALVTGRDAYGCVPQIVAEEIALGVKASFQVAVGRRHPHDVNYRIEDDAVRDYLRVIPDSGFDLCLHGSYRSTENPQWYVEEVALLSQRLGVPAGSRQHFLSFDYDVLFTAQERAGIRFDMSMGFPDRPGPRAGFSYPYFPYCLEQDRPYDVVEISLFLMDVTLRGYMGLKGEQAWKAIEDAVADLRRKRGCASVVWHPIVFGGARDPGFDRLFWALVKRVRASGGLATDGISIDEFWRSRAGSYASFSGLLSRRHAMAPVDKQDQRG